MSTCTSHTCMRVCMYECIDVRLYMCMYVSACLCISIYMCMYVCICTCSHMHTRVRICVYVRCMLMILNKVRRKITYL